MYLFIESDSFAAKGKEVGAEVQAQQNEQSIDNDSAVRRPYRGIQIKDDTYAALSVRGPDGKPVYLTSSSSRIVEPGGTGETDIGAVRNYSDFILQSVQDQRQEKSQIIETFGEPYVYIFGERPRVFTFSGLLVNTEDFNWRAQFWANYEENFRGTRLVQRNARAYLSYDTLTIEGYPLSASAVDDANQPYSIPFQMTMLVTNYYEYSTIGSMRFPGFEEASDEQLDAANKLLEDRGKYVSTTQLVREANLREFGKTRGALSVLRSGIRLANQGLGFVREATATVSAVTGGRIVRQPVYVSALVANTGAAQFAQGSISTGLATTALFDAITGTFTRSRIGSVKIREPAARGFSKTWRSAHPPYSHRGYIFENVDEYPLLDDSVKTLEDLSLSLSTQWNLAELGIYREARAAVKSTDEMFYASLDELDGVAGTVQTTLAEIVQITKIGFGMVANAIAFVGNPQAVLEGATGVQFRTLGSNFKAGLSGWKQRFSWVGEQVSRPWNGWKDAPDNPGAADPSAVEFDIDDDLISTAYGRGATAEDLGRGPQLDPGGGVGTLGQAQQDEDRDPVYGDGDYSGSAGDSGVQSALNESYGDNDSASEGSDITPTTISNAVGSGVQPAQQSDFGRAFDAQAAQAGNEGSWNEYGAGIRGVEDDDAPIKPAI